MDLHKHHVSSVHRKSVLLPVNILIFFIREISGKYFKKTSVKLMNTDPEAGKKSLIRFLVWVNTGPFIR
jgi:hypothetical protein